MREHHGRHARDRDDQERTHLTGTPAMLTSLVTRPSRTRRPGQLMHSSTVSESKPNAPLITGGIPGPGTIPLFATANLLLKFGLRGKERWEYLDQIWDAAATAQRVSLSVLPALMLRARRERPDN
jgi:hypothetical protein